MKKREFGERDELLLGRATDDGVVSRADVDGDGERVRKRERELLGPGILKRDVFCVMAEGGHCCGRCNRRAALKAGAVDGWGVAVAWDTANNRESLDGHAGNGSSSRSCGRAAALLIVDCGGCGARLSCRGRPLLSIQAILVAILPLLAVVILNCNTASRDSASKQVPAEHPPPQALAVARMQQSPIQNSLGPAKVVGFPSQCSARAVSSYVASAEVPSTCNSQRSRSSGRPSVEFEYGPQEASLWLLDGVGVC